MAASRKEYELMMKLTAALGPNFNVSFKAAMDTTNKLQGTLQNLKKQQNDISAYQKAENHVKSLREEKERLESATDRNEKKIEQVNKKLAEEENRLADLSKRLQTAGVDTNNLSDENARLEKSYNDLKNAQEDFTRANAALEQNSQAIAATRKELLTTVGAATAAGAALYKGFVEPAANFQSEMSNLAAITGATTDEINLMSDGILQISKITGTPLLDIAANAKMVAEAGGDVNLMMEQLTHGTNLANATQSAMATTLDFLCSSMKTFGLDTDDTQEAVDSLAMLTTMANLELAQIGAAFTTAGGAAAQAGLSIHDVNAILYTFAERGLKGGDAGDKLNIMLRKLSTPSNKAADSLDFLNVKLYDLEGNSRNTWDIILDLESALSVLDDETRNFHAAAILGADGIKGFRMLMDEGITSVMEISEELSQSSDAFDGFGQSAGMAATQLDNLKGDSALAKAAIHNLAITIGEMLMPAIRGGTQSIAENINKAHDFVIGNQETIKTVAKVATGLVAAKIAFLAVKLAVLSVVGVHKTLIATKAAYNVIQTAANNGTKLSTALTMVDTETKAGQNAVLIASGKALWGKVTAGLAEAKSVIASTAATATKKTVEIAGTVAAKAATAALIVKTGATKAAAAAQWLFNAAMTANPIGLIIVAVGALIAIIVLLVKNWDTVKEKFAEVWGKATEIFSNFMNGLREKAPFLASIIEVPINAIKGYIAGLKQFFTGIVDFVAGVFTGDWGRAWDGVKNIFGGAFGALEALAKAPLRAVVTVINGVIGGLNKMTVPDWVPGIGGKGINIPLIPMFQKGSNYTPDTFIAGDVGGKGGELVTNARGYKVFTADETDRILDTISRVKAVSAITPNVSNSDTPRISIPSFPSMRAGGGDTLTYNDNTVINVNGNAPEDLEEKLKQHKENVIQAIKELLRKQRDDEGRMVYA